MFFSTLWSLLATSLLLAKPHDNKKSNHHFLFALETIRETRGLIWVDLENVRGRSGFGKSHEDLLEQTAQWASHYHLTQNVIVVADHGSLSQAYTYQHANANVNVNVTLAIVFSGNHQKADDILAQHVAFATSTACSSREESTTVMVVTADTELKSRCQRTVSKSTLTIHNKRGIYFLDPTTFLEDLEATTAILKQEKTGDSSTGHQEHNDAQLSVEAQVELGELDEEIQLRAMILDTKVQLDDRRGKIKKGQITNKRRKKLLSKLDTLQSKLAQRGPSLLSLLTSMDDDILRHPQQEIILKRWQNMQRHRKEQTGDRVVLAEHLRRQLEEMEARHDRVTSKMDGPAIAFVQHFNKLNQPVSCASQRSTREQTTSIGDATTQSSPLAKPPTTKALLCHPFNNPLVGLKTLQIVAISDTHGFEGQLVTESLDDSGVRGELLPAGDVLFHLGDFALEGSPGAEKKALEAFDKWLAQQPHPIKIVVRGNHDPLQYAFPASGAWYITEATTISLTPNLVLGVIPHGPTTMRKKSSIPKACDILATHVPPYNVGGLDRTCTGKAAGSIYLTKLVRSMQDKPRLWLCGHIHEGRGVAIRQWGAQTTTVINAANANAGRAMQLDHDPVIVLVDNDDRLLSAAAANSNPVTIVSMGNNNNNNDKPSNNNNKADMVRPSKEGQFVHHEEPENSETTSLLLAVDMGLKSGLSLFNSKGKLLRYEQFQFDRDQLPETAKRLVAEWEAAVNVNNSNDNDNASGTHQNNSRLTHIAVEGVNGYMLQAWAEAAPSTPTMPCCVLLKVSPEEWRAELLNKKERQNGGQDAKAAARLIARQVVDDYGVMGTHQGKFKTDVAEAVCLGLYASRRLGWIQQEPAVRRYSNGNVVVPKKV
jgi:Calcineurin-like phosphoesterase